MEDILEKIDYELITYLAKKTRLENNLIIDAVSNHLSRSTVSNIEKRRGRTSLKAVAQYLTNLGLNKKQVLQKMKALENEIEDLQFQLELVQIFLDEKKPVDAKNILDNFHFADFHPLTAKVKYLIGRYYYIQDDLQKAKQCFFQAISIYEKNNYFQPNLLPACYNTLSTCNYYQEKLEEALKYVDIGLHYFDEKHSHSDLKYLLLVNKVLYLIVLGQHELAFKIINQIWDDIHTIEPIKVRLNFYKFKAQLLKKSRQYDQAIQCAQQGIYIARKNKDRNRNLALLIVLGTIYLELDNLCKAKTCFHAVIAFQDFRFPRRLVDGHVYLGILHAKDHNWKEAESHLLIAKKISEEYQVDVRRSIKLLVVYGNIMRQQEKFEQAIKLYNRANRLATEKQLPNLRLDGLFQLLKCYRALNDHVSFNQTNLELFKLQDQLHQQNNINLYENAGPSFTNN